jgi:hypothetical protein
MEHRYKDEINRTNKVSYTKCIQIAFIINPNWIKGRREGSYQDCCTLMRMVTTRIELTNCRKARPDFAAPRRPTAVAPWMGSGLQVLITLILIRCRPARPLSHRPCVFQVTVSLRLTTGSLAPCSGPPAVTDCRQSVGLTPAGRLSDFKSGRLCSSRCSEVTGLTPSLSQ